MDSLLGKVTMTNDPVVVSRFEDLTVTSVSPLRLIRTGVDTVPLPFAPDSLIDPVSLSIDDRVRCEWAGTRLIIHGKKYET